MFHVGVVGMLRVFRLVVGLQHFTTHFPLWLRNLLSSCFVSLLVSEKNASLVVVCCLFLVDDTFMCE